jgi:hypothetical protein
VFGFLKFFTWEKYLLEFMIEKIFANEALLRVGFFFESKIKRN